MSAASAEDAGSTRNRGRDSLLLSAPIRVGDGDVIQVRVRNLSAGGLMAEFALPVMTGTPVEVEVRGVGLVSGRVAWSTEGRIGIAFDRQIDPMLARKPVGHGKQTPTFVKPPIARR